MLEDKYELIYVCTYVCVSLGQRNDANMSIFCGSGGNGVNMCIYCNIGCAFCIVSSASEGTLLHIQYMLVFAPVLGCLAQWRDCCVEVFVLQ